MSGYGIPIGDHLELTPRGLNVALPHTLNHRLVFTAILNEVSNRAELQVVCTTVFDQIGQSRHRAIRLQDFANHRGRRQTSHCGQVATRLGMPSTHQHASWYRT